MKKNIVKLTFLQVLIGILLSYLGEWAYCETTYFIYNAPTRSATALTNQSQDVVNKYEYTGFGNLSSALEAVNNTHKYVGEQQEPENNPIFLRARYYDPSIRWFVVGGLGGIWFMRINGVFP